MLVVDTGPLVAAADIGDRDHQACLQLLGTAQGPLVVSPLVVAEAAYLIGRQLGSQSEAEFFRSLSDGELLMESLTPADLVRMAELVETYADLGLGPGIYQPSTGTPVDKGEQRGPAVTQEWCLNCGNVA